MLTQRCQIGVAPAVVYRRRLDYVERLNALEELR